MNLSCACTTSVSWGEAMKGSLWLQNNTDNNEWAILGVAQNCDSKSDKGGNRKGCLPKAWAKLWVPVLLANKAENIHKKMNRLEIMTTKFLRTLSKTNDTIKTSLPSLLTTLTIGRMINFKIHKIGHNPHYMISISSSCAAHHVFFLVFFSILNFL